MNMGTPQQHGNAFRASLEMRQERSFGVSRLPLTSGWAQDGVDLHKIVASLPPEWPLEDRLVALAFPELESSIFAFHYGGGPSMSELMRSPAAIESLDVEVVRRLDEIQANWGAGDHVPLRVLSHRRTETEGVVDLPPRPLPTVEVSLSNGVALVELTPGAEGDWTSGRRNLVVALCTALFAYQRDFLSAGAAAIKPLSMQKLAAMLGVHESTASRALSGIVANTPQGSVPIRELFGVALRSATSAEVSSQTAKVLLRKLFNEDATLATRTDAELVELLEMHGVILARRTVAKYRAQLGLPKASRRSRPSGR